jgi:hypothetical protein
MDVLLQAKGWLLAAAAVLAGGHGAPAHATAAHHPQTRTEHRLQLGSNLTVSTQGSVVRTDSCWECVEPAPGVWDWHYDDTLARELGQRWQPVLDYAPGWATPAGRTPPPGGWSAAATQNVHRAPPRPTGSAPAATFAVSQAPPSNFGAYVHYVTAFVRRYHPRVVEIWNEPDIYVYWNPPQPARYGRLYALAYRAIKRVAPNTVVLASGLDLGDAGWFVPMMVRGLHGLRPDGWSVHPYANSVAAMRRVLSFDERVLRRQHVLAPLYVTEYGCFSLRRCPNGAEFRRAAIRMLARDPDVVQADWFGDLHF